VEGIRPVILNTALPNGISSNLQLDNILYVSSLHNNVFSWIVVKSKAVLLAKDNSMHIFYHNDLVHPILVIDLRDKYPLLWEAVNNNCVLVANNPNACALGAQSPHSSNLSVLVAYNLNIGFTSSLGTQTTNMSELGAHTPNMSYYSNTSSTSLLGPQTSNMSELGAHTSNMSYNCSTSFTSSLGT